MTISLPPEILSNILLIHRSSGRDIFHAALVCKDWCRIFLPLLGRSAVIGSPQHPSPFPQLPKDASNCFLLFKKIGAKKQNSEETQSKSLALLKKVSKLQLDLGVNVGKTLKLVSSLKHITQMHLIQSLIDAFAVAEISKSLKSGGFLDGIAVLSMKDVDFGKSKPLIEQFKALCFPNLVGLSTVHLDIPHSNIQMNVITSFISSHPNLVMLTCPILSIKDLEALKPLHNLRHLIVCTNSNDFIAHSRIIETLNGIGRLSPLWSFGLISHHSTPVDILNLAHSAPNLRELLLRIRQIKKTKDFSSETVLPSMRAIDFSGFSSQDLDYIVAASAPTLEVLVLDALGRFSRTLLASCTNLRVLNLGKLPFDKDELLLLMEKTPCMRIFVSYSRTLPVPCLIEIPVHWRRLERLSINFVGELEVFQTLLQKMPLLRIELMDLPVKEAISYEPALDNAHVCLDAAQSIATRFVIRTGNMEIKVALPIESPKLAVTASTRGQVDVAIDPAPGNVMTLKTERRIPQANRIPHPSM
ncbi:hypothetical protein HDU97_007017 [Phlyctochytrium planicorne]|nr:hypothetical protein HDU97_007017 [Phlyctochytrium planicorne]